MNPFVTLIMGGLLGGVGASAWLKVRINQLQRDLTFTQVDRSALEDEVKFLEAKVEALSRVGARPGGAPPPATGAAQTSVAISGGTTAFKPPTKKAPAKPRRGLSKRQMVNRLLDLQKDLDA